MPKKHPLRRRYFVDFKVQGALGIRVIVYWMMSLLTLSFMLLCWRMTTGPARMFWDQLADTWRIYGPAAIASLMLLPVVVIDVIRLSNRFAGPIFRLRRGMRALAQGEAVEPIHFRDGDFWQDFAEEFNALAARIQAAERAARTSDHAMEEPVGAGV